MDKSIDEQTPMVYAFYAQGHMVNLCLNGLEFKPCAECMSIMWQYASGGSAQEDKEIES